MRCSKLEPSFSRTGSAGPSMCETAANGTVTTSATLWEATRFCIHPEADPRTEQSIAAEILMGICEVGLMSGLTGIIGVYDPRLIRIYGRIGWRPEPLARSTKYDAGPIYVGVWEVSELALAGMRARAGISYSVLDGMPTDVRAA